MRATLIHNDEPWEGGGALLTRPQKCSSKQCMPGILSELCSVDDVVFP